MKTVIFIKNQIIKGCYYICSKLNLDKKTLRVICYHSISNNGNKYSISLNQFKKEILSFKKYYKFVSVKEALEKREDENSKILLTIDDGYKDVLSIVNFLKKNKVPVLLFVLSDPKKVNRKELDHSGNLLTTNDIKKLHKQDWAIGNHSATHADFSKLSTNEMRKEIQDSKKDLEKKLGFKIDYFAYPKGEYSEKIISTVKKAGYKAAFATYPAVINKTLNTYKIPRFVMEKDKNTFSIPFSFSFSTQILRNLFIKL